MKPETIPDNDTADEPDRYIMLIDDSCLQARIFTAQAKQLHYAVKVATSREQALAWLKQSHAMAVFIELHLLHDNGFAVGQTVMDQAQLPCVLLTGLLKNTDREWARQLGFSSVLERPMEKDDLHNALVEYLPVHAGPSGAGMA